MIGNEGNARDAEGDVGDGGLGCDRSGHFILGFSFGSPALERSNGCDRTGRERARGEGGGLNEME
jgi:hypothetical protein